ncbi:hypothetical protein [Streptomyces sp. NPDC001933]|uniref:hypothetical protein n=1 Tax=Streptomyces sp. NPDC001933 TaxID=3364626 RepID=UPI0036822066
MREYVDNDVLLVDEEDIRRALRTVRDTLGLILELSGAFGIAAGPASRPRRRLSGHDPLRPGPQID